MSDPRHRPILITLVLAVAAACLAVALTSGGSSESATSEPTASTIEANVESTTPLEPGDSSAPSSTDSSVPTTDESDSLAPHQQDLVGSDPAATEDCTLTERSLNSASTGKDVVCLQEALREAGFYSGDITGIYDNSVIAAVKKVQTERDLFVDGKVGRETALSLGIWPDENSLVVRTPPPPPGAKDLMGFPLSSVATSGPDAPPLPDNSGSGRRVVYSRAGQRVWAVDENDQVIRSWLVSGSKYNNETPGTHKVYSRSDVSTAWNGKAFLPKMIRWLKTDIGNIGFHAIPLHRSDNSPYQTEAELGSRLSGGCQRQANADADFMWEFAQIGTVVVVV